jgi:hypothetical protein
VKRALALVLLAACGDRGRAVTTTASATTASAPPAPPARATTAPTASASVAPAPPALPLGAEERFLLEAPLASLSPARGPLRRGGLDVLLGEERRAATLDPAPLADPVGYRRPLAYARLARAIGARVVPATVLRRVSAGELAHLAEGSAELLATVRAARVLNDGTVDALLAARAPAHAGSPWEAPEGMVVHPESGAGPAAWERWARSASPLPGEDAGLLRDYVEMLVLDYLAANVSRQRVQVVGKALVLADNASAFPARIDAPTLDKMLRRLRAVERFPRGLLASLAALDRARADAVFAEGSFSERLLSPRVLIELDERRAALFTLIDARVTVRGADAVLCL